MAAENRSASFVLMIKHRLVARCLGVNAISEMKTVTWVPLLLSRGTYSTVNPSQVHWLRLLLNGKKLVFNQNRLINRRG